MRSSSAMRGYVDADIIVSGIDSELEVVGRCVLCGSPQAEILFTTRDRKHRLPGLFAFLRCSDCGMGRLSPRPRPDRLGSYYPNEDYYAYQSGTHERGWWSRRVGAVREKVWAAELGELGYPIGHRRGAEATRKLLPREAWRRSTYGWEGIPRFVPEGRALDVGCGNGAFLHLLKQAGWEVVGFDVGEAAALAAKRSFDLEVHTGRLEELPFAPASFDFVHINHVIEHVADPVQVIGQVANLLRPNGQLYIETPNVDSFSLRHWHTQWLHVDSPRHLWMFSHGTLKRALQSAGLVVDRVYGRGSFRYYRWEWTFQREALDGHPVPHRPRVDIRHVPRLLAVAAVGAAAAVANPTSGEVICCWAHLDGPTKPF